MFFSSNYTHLEKLQLKITKKEMYREDEPLVQTVIDEMISLPIQHVGKLNSLPVSVLSDSYEIDISWHCLVTDWHRLGKNQLTSPVVTRLSINSTTQFNCQTAMSSSLLLFI